MTVITVGLINNMPDSALAETESQFCALLNDAAPSALEVRCTSMPEVPRGEAARAHIAGNYWPIEEFLRAPPDALIVTGTEPLAADLRDEPYWPRVAAVVEWARSRALPSIWSCLAAHAAVLHLSGIRRQRLAQKCCGIFRHDISSGHALMRRLGETLVTPHSRWNDLPVAALQEAGYSILSAGPETGANIFELHQGAARMIFLQGHPEYASVTLLKEYRRDIGRYVRAQQPHYPTLPQDYFCAQTVELLNEFRQRAELNRRPQIMADFPAAAVEASLRNTWHAQAVNLYRNWLELVAAGGREMVGQSGGMLQ